jgi:predicted small metal-binding protein
MRACESPSSRARKLEETMGRKFIDCRETPSVTNCSIAISADEEELIDAAVQHAVSVHGHKDTPDFRKLIKGAIREGAPPLKASPRTA